jgi:hypothetical protein
MHEDLELAANVPAVQVQGPLPGWPPEESPVWANKGRSARAIEPLPLDTNGLADTARELRRWAPQILAAQHDVAGERQALVDCVVRLQS